MTAWLFDSALAAGLLWLAWRVIVSRTLFAAVLLFIALGLLMALSWVRLAAPDVALAEAAIGAGLTGALLLAACTNLQDSAHDGRREHACTTTRKTTARDAAAPLLAILSIIVTAILGWTLFVMPEPSIDLAARIRASLPDTGVSNPVTAVLLNFRSYDTLLEVAVLLLALIGVCAVSAPRTDERNAVTSIRDAPMLDILIRLLVPIATLTASYLLWAGAHAPGGAFQAGALLAGVGVLLYLGQRLEPVATATYHWRVLPVFGLAVFSAIALCVMALTGNLLQYPPAWAGGLILLIESCLTISIASTLVLLFCRTPALRRQRP